MQTLAAPVQTMGYKRLAAQIVGSADARIQIRRPGLCLAFRLGQRGPAHF